MNRYCEFCGKPFDRMRATKRFCSDACRYRYHKRGKSLLTTVDMVELRAIGREWARTYPVLTKLVVRNEGNVPLANIHAEFFVLLRRLRRRIDIEMKHGAYDVTEEVDAHQKGRITNPSSGGTGSGGTPTPDGGGTAPG